MKLPEDLDHYLGIWHLNLSRFHTSWVAGLGVEKFLFLALSPASMIRGARLTGVSRMWG
jgi:hypothetical protein